MTRAHVTAMMAMLFGIAASCKSPVESRSTGSFAVTGVAVLNGRVLNAEGAPRDSFRVVASVPEPDGGQAFYSQLRSAVTASDGAFALQMDQSVLVPSGVPDSVPIVLVAESIRFSDRNADGSVKRLRRDVFVKFTKPSLTPLQFALDFVVP